MASTSPAAESWHDLARQARTLESKLERNIHAYSAFNASFAARGSSIDSNGTAGDVESGGAAGGGDDADGSAALEARIEQCLVSLLDVTDRMARCAAATRTKAHSVFLKRYGEILCDHTTEYRSIKASIAKKRDTAKLFKEIHDGSRRGLNRQQAEPLLRERAAITQSSRAADDVLDHAISTHTSLKTQHTSLRNSGAKFSNLASKFPVVNSIMDAINRRRSRNNTVIALVIAACVCFTLWYIIS